MYLSCKFNLHMDRLVLFNDTTCNNLLNKRPGESKFGQDVKIINNISNIYEQLKNLDVDFVLIGLPEDIGIYANYGKVGASQTWKVVLKSLLNIQSNQYTQAHRVLILGHLDFSEEFFEIAKLDISKNKTRIKARKIVTAMDTHVTQIVYTIIRAGKTPIIIGGGHNNAYGNIKGTSLALNTPINAINFDAHTDFRMEEGRHSGNGFSYAYTEGFLNKYFIFGLHANYIQNEVLKKFKKLKNIRFNTYEALEVTKTLRFNNECEKALSYISNTPFGIEIDCDAIKNIPSSAMTPSGFSVKKTRQFLHLFAQHENAKYLHICEATPTKKTASQIGKLISFFITDFVAAKTN